MMLRVRRRKRTPRRRTRTTIRRQRGLTLPTHSAMRHRRCRRCGQQHRVIGAGVSFGRETRRRNHIGHSPDGSVCRRRNHGPGPRSRRVVNRLRVPGHGGMIPHRLVGILIGVERVVQRDEIPRRHAAILRDGGERNRGRGIRRRRRTQRGVRMGRNLRRRAGRALMTRRLRRR